MTVNRDIVAATAQTVIRFTDIRDASAAATEFLESFAQEIKS